MSAKSSYRDAVVDDGRQVLYEVTSRLYKGRNLRPDIYFQRDPKLKRKNYNKIFDVNQRQTIANSGSEALYDIRQGARHFDVSVHADLISHTCDLSPSDSLRLKVDQVRKLRNAVCHPSEPTDVWQIECYDDLKDTNVTDENLSEKLRELLELYEGIIEDLGDKTGDNLQYVRTRMKSMIMSRMKSEVGNNQAMQTYGSSDTHHAPTRSISTSSSGIPTWGKVALGVAGIAGLAIGAAVAANGGESATERRRKEQAKRNKRRNNNDQEECTVM